MVPEQVMGSSGLKVTTKAQRFVIGGELRLERIGAHACVV